MSQLYRFTYVLMRINISTVNALTTTTEWDQKAKEKCSLFRKLVHMEIKVQIECNSRKISINKLFSLIKTNGNFHLNKSY